MLGNSIAVRFFKRVPWALSVWDCPIGFDCRLWRLLRPLVNHGQPRLAFSFSCGVVRVSWTHSI
jgi:hypothetical protein